MKVTMNQLLDALKELDPDSELTLIPHVAGMERIPTLGITDGKKIALVTESGTVLEDVEEVENESI